jgi:thioredoxin 1
MGKTIAVTDSTFDEVVLKATNPVLVDFWATWCAPCRMLAPVIDKLAEQYEGKIAVAKVDVDNNQELAMRYGIQSIPTVILFKDGKINSKEVGVKPLKSFTNLLDSQIA